MYFSFYDIYGSSILFTSIIFIILLIVIIYTSYTIFITYVRNNWTKLQCTPPYMLLADKVISDSYRTPQQIRQDHLNSCLDEMEKEPLNSVDKKYSKSSENLAESSKKTEISIDQTDKDIEETREIQKTHVDSIQGILNYTSLIFQNTITQMKDIFGRFLGIAATSIYTLEKTFDAFLSTIQRMKRLFKEILTIMIIFLLFLIPQIFSNPLLITVLLILTISTGLLPIIGLIGHVFSYSNVLTNPEYVHAACFDESTSLKVNDNYIPISYILPGDIIDNNVKVTSTIKILCPEGQKMIRYKGIVMTSEHRIYKGNLCLETEYIPGAEVIDYTPTYLYCLNTDTKRIPINDEEFTDWDDVDNREIDFLKEKCNLMNVHQFHGRFNTGFHPNTIIEMSGNKNKHIKDIECGEYTANGEQIVGIVQSYGGTIPLFTCDDIILTDHMIVRENTLSLKPTLECCSTIYHVITDTRYIRIGKYSFRDYDGPIENILTS